MRTVRLFDLDFVADTSVEEIAEVLVDDARESSATWRVVVTPNVDHLVRYRKSDELRPVAQSAYLVLPDGAPIVLASRLLGSPIDQRIAGSDLFIAWWRRVMAQHRPILIIAGNEQLAEQLRSEHPGCRCLVPPMFRDTDRVAVAELVGQVVDELAGAPVDAVVIGLSTVKSHLVAAGLIASEPPTNGAPLVLLFGASAEFHVGQQRRAPRWMQRTGTEWLYRLLGNPRRMAKRYLVDDMAFFPMVWREWRQRRAANKNSSD